MKTSCLPMLLLPRPCADATLRSPDSHLDATDWSSTGLKYMIAVQVLRDELDQAANTLRLLLRSGELTERQLLEWPVVRLFRESKPCREVFREVSGHDLGVLISEPADSSLERTRLD
jgi:hypothetical protein